MGAIDDEVASEAEAFERARRFLSYLPSSVAELPPLTEPQDDPERREEALLNLVPKDPRKVYKMRQLLNMVMDRDSFFEIGCKWGTSMITGFARLDGVPIAVFAEDPFVYGGAWTADAYRKLRRLIDLASMFHLPLVHFEDCPGFLIGKKSEEESTIRYGSRSPGCARSIAHAVLHRGDAQSIWRRRWRQPQAGQSPFSLRLALRGLGLVVH